MVDSRAILGKNSKMQFDPPPSPTSPSSIPKINMPTNIKLAMCHTGVELYKVGMAAELGLYNGHWCMTHGWLHG